MHEIDSHRCGQKFNEHLEIMKVDKAVSTTKEISNELNGTTIKYESLLKSLIEQKFTAIKRECEQNQKPSKSKTFFKRWRRRRNIDTMNEERQCGDNIIENKMIEVCDPIAGNVSDSVAATEEQVNHDENKSRSNRKVVSETIQMNSNEVDDALSCAIDETVKLNAETGSGEGAIVKPIRSARRSSSISKRTTLSTPTVEFNFEQEQQQQQQHHRLRVLEARSISAQCSPIFPRQSFDASTKTSIPQRMCSRANTSDDSVCSSVCTDSVVQVIDDMEAPSSSTMTKLKTKRNSANESINNISSSSLKSKANSNKLTSSDLTSAGAKNKTITTITATTTATTATQSTMPAAMSSSKVHIVPTNCISGRRKHGSDESHKIRKFSSLFLLVFFSVFNKETRKNDETHAQGI